MNTTPSSQQPDSTRRDFLRQVAGGALVLGAGAALSPASLLGATGDSGAATAASAVPAAVAGRKAQGKLTPLYWSPATVVEPWRESLRALAEYYPVKESTTPVPGALELRMVQTPGAAGAARTVDAAGAAKGATGAGTATATRSGDTVTIEAQAGFPVGRMVAYALAGRVEAGKPVSDRAHFVHQAIMFDVARNAVLTPEALRRWFCQMYLMGYNQAVLYLEDVFTIPGEPYFGYLRGRYSEEDLKAIDQSAADFGIELIASIQTLSHLARILKWPVYSNIRRNAHTLIVGKKESYDLIEKMVDVISRSIRSRRIHVGMDESTQITYEDFQKHLNRVNDICRKRGYTDVDIWSDMYFRMNSKKHDYYDKEIVIPDSMKGCVPEGVNLVYWDYNSFDKDFYVKWVQKHRELSGGKAPVVAGGLRTWGRSFWYEQHRIDSTLVPNLQGSKEAGVDEVMFTMWRDDGAFSHYNSTLGGLAFASDMCFENGTWAAEVFDAVIGVPYDAIQAVSSASKQMFTSMLAWDDPLLGTIYKMHNRTNKETLPKVVEQYDGLLKELQPYADVTEPVDMAFGVAMIRFLRDKIAFKLELDKAYQAKDRKAVGKIVQQQMPELMSSFDAFLQAFRRQWNSDHRPNGIEVMQARFGAQLLRLQDARQRLLDYADGRIDSIPELDEDIVPPVSRRLTREGHHQPLNWSQNYTTAY